MIGRSYRDPGDKLAGYFDPPRLCTVINRASFKPRSGPRNVAVEYADDGSRAVIPSRRLRLPLTPSAARP